MVEESLLDHWAEKSAWARYLQIDQGTGICFEGENYCSEAYVNALGAWTPPTDSADPDLEAAVTAIKQAWADANRTAKEALSGRGDITGHRIGVHLSAEGPRLVMVLAEATHDVEEPHEHAPGRRHGRG